MGVSGRKSRARRVRGGRARARAQEELGVSARIGNEIAHVHYAYEDFDLTLVLFEAYTADEPKAIGVAEVGWFHRRELRDLEMPPADLPLLEAIERSFDDTVA